MGLSFFFYRLINDRYMNKTFYLTTAIDYANGSPHLGHAYEKILSDVIIRTKQLNGVRTHFVTGLDEHGQKVQQGAESEGISPQERCDRIAGEFKNLLVQLDISHNDYIRTTESRHKKVVSSLLQDLFDGEKFIRQSIRAFIQPGQNNFFRKKIRWMENGLKFMERSQKLPKVITFSS